MTNNHSNSIQKNSVRNDIRKKNIILGSFLVILMVLFVVIAAISMYKNFGDH